MMAIRFGCGCGREYTVADGLAGKRTKCSGCGAALTVPAVAAEDEALRVLLDGPEPAAAAPSWREPSAAPPPPGPSPQAAVAAAAAMRAVKASEAAPAPRRSRRERRGEYSEFALSPAVAGGLVSMAVAGLWLAVSLSNNRVPIYAPVLFLFGLVAVVRGLLGLSED